MATAVIELDQELESIVPPETSSTALVLQGAVAIEKIGDATSYFRVSSAGSDAAANINNITAAFEPICSQRYARWKRSTALRAEKLAPFEEVKKKSSSLIGVYEREQEQIRLAEEARLQEEARIDAEKRQAEQRKLAEAEAKRLADEQAIQDAIALEAAGDTKGAEAVLANPAPVEVYVPPVYVPPVIVPRSIPKVAGQSGSTTWKFRIKRSAKCAAVGPHLPEECEVCLADVPRAYLILNTKLVGQLVRASKEKFNIPGIDPYPEGGARFTQKG